MSDPNPLPPTEARETAPQENDAFDTVSVSTAEELKVQGNDYFRERRWSEALISYRSALGHLPKKIKRKATIPENPDEISAEASLELNDADHVQEELPHDPSSSQTTVEYAKLRAILNANIGACYVKLGDHKQAVDACSQALDDDPQYIKALQRRAASNEVINSWSSLSAAQEDYSNLVKILPPSSKQMMDAQRSMTSLKPRVEAAQKRETAEMLDKLKGLGNSILGNFGLSTDNFKFEPNGQGGYSMNFSR